MNKNKFFLILGLLAVLITPQLVSAKAMSDTPNAEPGTISSLENSTSAKANLKLDLFYSNSCPHCAKERQLLNNQIKGNYNNLEIRLHPVSKEASFQILKCFYKKYGVAKRDKGAIPATFIGEDYYIGFSKNIKNKIKESIESQVNSPPSNYNTPTTSNLDKNCTNSTSSEQNKDKKIGNLPFIGEINPSKYSLPVLTVILGALDGFNVCSLGALILILGMVIALRSRKQILTFGGIFILTTAVVYGFLIVLWYKLFQFFQGYLGAMEFFVGLLASAGSFYFLKEFVRMKKQGATCEGGLMEGFKNKLVKKVKGEIQQADKTNIAAVAGSILVFAAIITVVEFPCSAGSPLAFAAILADANLTGFQYLIHVAFFVLFYLLDELVIFGIAVWKMTVWMESPQFVTWVTLVEALVLLGLGLWYFPALWAYLAVITFLALGFWIWYKCY